MSIRSNRHESSPLLSIHKSGSRFARDLEFVALLGFEGGLKMLRFETIRSNRHESSPLKSIRKSGSRFARDLEFVYEAQIKIAHRIRAGVLDMCEPL